MRFLSTFRLRMIVVLDAVFLAVYPLDFVGAGFLAKGREVDTVRTHVSDASALIESLRHHHRLTDGEAQFAGGLLLQGRCRERRSRHTLERFLAYRLYGEGGILAFLQESVRLFLRLEPLVEFGFYLVDITVVVILGEDGTDAEVRFAVEFLNLPLALNDESNSHTLYTPGRESWLHLSPQHGRELEAHDTVEHTPCLLCVDEVHVQVARMLDGIENSRLGNFMEDDAARLLLIQSEYFAKVPADGFSLAVLIGCQPDLLGLLGARLQFAYQFFLLFRYLIVGYHVFLVDAELFLFEVSDVTVGRHHFVVFAQELFYFFCLSGTLDDN